MDVSPMNQRTILRIALYSFDPYKKGKLFLIGFPHLFIMTLHFTRVKMSRKPIFLFVLPMLDTVLKTMRSAF